MNPGKDLLTNELFPSTREPVMLHGATDLEGFRQAARSLLARQVPPEQVSWHTTDAPVQDLFSTPDSTVAAANAQAFSAAPAVKVPAEFMALCESVILHRDPNRFGLLYRISGAWHTSPACAMTRLIRIGSGPPTWRRPCGGTCTR